MCSCNIDWHKTDNFKQFSILPSNKFLNIFLITATCCNLLLIKQTLVHNVTRLLVEIHKERIK